MHRLLFVDLFLDLLHVLYMFVSLVSGWTVQGDYYGIGDVWKGGSIVVVVQSDGLELGYLSLVDVITFPCMVLVAVHGSVYSA